MRHFSLFLITLLGCGSLSADDRPNILFIFSDDRALRTIGAYEGSINKTPNLDRIAEEGAIFNRSFNVNSICCPSRAAIMTGKHSHANGIWGNGSDWNGKQWVYPRELGKAGYETGLIGKWHLKGNPTDEFQSWEILSGKGGQGSYYNPKFLVYSSDQGFLTGEHGWAEKRWMYEESFKSPLCSSPWR